MLFSLLEIIRFSKVPSVSSLFFLSIENVKYSSLANVTLVTDDESILKLYKSSFECNEASFCRITVSLYKSAKNGHSIPLKTD